MNFEFATAEQIIFGPGSASKVPELAAGLGGQRAFVVTGRSAERQAGLISGLNSAGLSVEVFTVSREPTVALVRLALEAARQAGSDCVIAVGGGSVIDTGKAVAALLTNSGSLEVYLEVVGRGLPLTHPALPCIAVPTTSGTGAEVTRNSVLGVPEKAVKVSLRSPFLLPRFALVDPLLTHSLPPAATAATGLDALTQLLEAFVSRRANPFTDSLCREGLRRAGRSLRKAFRHGDNSAAREDMSLASLFGGLALANAGLGAVHGFAGPLGGMLDAPHGALCAALLPGVIRANLEALENEGNAAILLRYFEAARLLSGDPDIAASDLPDWALSLCRDLEINSLGRLGLRPEMIPEAVEKAARASSMKGNPVELSPAELTDLLQKCL